MTNDTDGLASKWRPRSGLLRWGFLTAAVIVAIWGYFPWWFDDRVAFSGLATAVIKAFGALVVAPFILGLVGGVLVLLDRPRREFLLIPLAGALTEFAAVELVFLSVTFGIWRIPGSTSELHGFDPLIVASGVSAALFAFVVFAAGAALGRLSRWIWSHLRSAS